MVLRNYTDEHSEDNPKAIIGRSYATVRQTDEIT